jgi:hypothetical protein
MWVAKNPVNCFSCGVASIEDTGNEMSENVASRFPVLNVKEADIDVVRAFGGNAGSIDHFDARFIVLIKDGSLVLFESKFA